MLRSFLLPVSIGTLSALAVAPTLAQVEDPTANVDPAVENFAPTPYLVKNMGLVPATIHHTGETVLLESGMVTRPMCGSNMSDVTVDDLERWNRKNAENLAAGYTVLDTTVNSGARGASGLNLVFNLSGNVPAEAVTAIAEAEAYIESQFGDPITVIISVDFFNFGNGGIIGSTSSSDTAVSYSTVRAAMIAGMDNDDTIQDFLPTGNTLSVRYTSTSTSVTNENRVFFNRATFEATIGSIGGTDASMSFNTQFNFDYDPSNGVPSNRTCFQSVFIHEVGHALGFTSGTDFRASDLEALDLFRFSRNDSVNGVNGDWNPDTNAEFQTTARLVDPDDPNTSTDNTEVDSNSDLIFAEYRMSDGFPNQASHFIEGLNGIMDPTLGGGQTFFPNFYRTSDLNMFDAVGYDFPPSAPTAFGPLAPANGAAGVSTEAVIEWEAATSADEYRLRVDNNAGFGSPEIDIMINSAFTSFTPTPGALDPLTTYFWTVDASNSIGTTTISPSSSSFTTTVLPVSTFTLDAPANFAITSLTPTLTWTASDNAQDYLVEVATNGIFSAIVVSETVAAPMNEYTIAPATLAEQTQYFWRVTAMNPGSSQISSPTARRFTTDTVPVNSCIADFDNDGDVDLGDFGVFGGAFNSMTGDANYDAAADFDNDGDVDLGDFGIFGGEFGTLDCLG